MGQIRGRPTSSIMKSNKHSRARGGHRGLAHEPPSTSHPSGPAADARRRKSVRELFEQFGIGRPSGWLSDEEDLLLSGDGNASPRRFCRVCHLCSARTWSPMRCSSCGHRLCKKCTCEIPERSVDSHVGFSHHRSRTIKRDRTPFVQPPALTPKSKKRQQSPMPRRMTSNSRPARHNVDQRSVDEGAAQGSLNSKQPEKEEYLREDTTSPLSLRRAESPRKQRTGSLMQNPFIIADKETKGAVARSPSVKQTKGQETRGRKDSHQHIKNSNNQDADANVECDNVMCRATHEGHYPYRHSISCTLYRSEQSERAANLAQSSPKSSAASESPLPEPQSTEEPSPELNHTVHRYHYIGFHDHHRVDEHPIMAAGHDSHDLGASRAMKSTREAPSAASFGSVANTKAESSKHLKPLTPAQSITRVSSVYFAPDTASPGHSRLDEYLQEAESSEDTRAQSKFKTVSRGERMSLPRSNQQERLVKMRSFQIPQNHDAKKHVQSTADSEGPSTWRERLARSSNTEDHFAGKRAANNERTERSNAPRTANKMQSETVVPRGHLLSPPSWLKTPRRDAGDARSRLRHVNTKSHERPSSPNTKDWKDKKLKHSQSSIHKFESVRDSFSRYTSAKQAFLRVAAPSPTTAMHVTHHQRPDSWHSPPSEHVQSRSIHRPYTNRAQASSSLAYQDSSLVGSQETVSRQNHQSLEESESNIAYGHPPSGLSDIRAIESRQRSLLSPSLSHSPNNQSSEHFEQFNRDHHLLRGQYRNGTSRAQAGPSNQVAENSPIRDATFSHLSTTSDGSRLPLQPLRIIPETSEGPISRGHNSLFDFGSRGDPSFTSDLELHRPTPIAPPNHYCSWKDRYLALTAEVRQLKAEIATRASLRGIGISDTGYSEEQTANQDEHLGLLGVTIVMHLKDKDDLVINTDLTQDYDDNTLDLESR
ncbi:hypothetical protein F5B20DRAFT_12956 [Whalleya microplaca]|nr:hypothetical protein F5B20DRAFT_12956 [Whalleya microplaca]